jgi:hypothetical protein
MRRHPPALDQVHEIRQRGDAHHSASNTTTRAATSRLTAARGGAMLTQAIKDATVSHDTERRHVGASY